MTMEQYPLLTHIKNPNNSHRTAKKREHLDNFFIIIFFLAVFFGDLFDSQLNMQCVTSYFAMVKISKLYANMRPCRRCLVLRLRYCINCIFTGITLINYMENKHFFVSCELWSNFVEVQTEKRVNGIFQYSIKCFCFKKVLTILTYCFGFFFIVLEDSLRVRV